MARLARALALVGLLCGILFLGPVAARDTSPSSLNAKRDEVVKRWQHSAHGRNRGRHGRRAPAPPKVKNITFKNPKASGAYARVYAFLVSLLMRFQSSTWMAHPFLWSTLMLARRGLA